MSQAHRPKLAAKVILLRPAEKSGFEVFLTREGEDPPNLGFPGGAVTKEDCSSGMLSRCRGLSVSAVRSIIGARFAPQEASGPWIACIRNLFLMAGVLLAVNEAGQDVMVDRDRRIRVLTQRDALRARLLTFESFLAKECLWGDASKLVYFSSWQTALPSGTCFDTYFYLVALSPDQSAFPACPRGVHGLWLSPDQSIRSCNRREWPMDFSTFASLRTLADFNSMQSVFKEYGGGSRG